jgi:hypothetical protein
MISKYRKRTTESLEDYAPEVWAIFRHLENVHETPQSKRVRRVLELLSSLGENPAGMAAVRITNELGSLLSGYRWVALISPTTEGYRPIFRREPEGKELSREDVWEYGVVTDLFNLMRFQGALSRLRQCRNGKCRKWLFTPKGKPKQFCDHICKQRDYDNDPARCAKKRSDMRTLRADEKERNRRNPSNRIGFKEQKRKARA